MSDRWRKQVPRCYKYHIWLVHINLRNILPIKQRLIEILVHVLFPHPHFVYLSRLKSSDFAYSVFIVHITLILVFPFLFILSIFAHSFTIIPCSSCRKCSLEYLNLSPYWVVFTLANGRHLCFPLKLVMISFQRQENKKCRGKMIRKKGQKRENKFPKFALKGEIQHKFLFLLLLTELPQKTRCQTQVNLN